MNNIKKIVQIVFFISVFSLFFSVSSVVAFIYPDKKIKIKVAHIYDPFSGVHGKANLDWIKNIIKRFEKDNPTIEVELEQIQWDHIDSKSMADFRAGIPHDVIWASPQLLPKHVLVGDLVDLTPLMEWNEEDYNDFNWNCLWEKTGSAGMRIALPLGAHARVCAYRKDFFRQAGLDPEKPPENLEQLVEYGKKLTMDTDKDGKTDIWGLGIYFGPQRATIEITFAPLLWHFGGRLWDPEKKRAVFASEAGVKAVEFFKDLMYKHKITPRWMVSGTYDDVIFRNFLNNKLAMAWGWGSYWIQPMEELGFVKGVFPPSLNAEETKAGIFVTPTKDQAQFTNAWLVAIHKRSKYPQESLKFINYLLAPASLINFPDAGLPARLSLWKRPKFETDFYKKWFEAVKYGRSMPSTAHYGELANTVSAALQEILVRNKDVRSTLLKFQEEYNRRFAGE